MKIYLAMAELPDGNRMFEKAYKTYSKAQEAANNMAEDVNSNTEWKVVPIIEDIELVDENE